MTKNHLLHAIVLKCDAPSCDYETAVSEITAEHLGARCPKCDAILLTEDDLRAARGMRAAFDVLAAIIPKFKRKAKPGETLLVSVNPHAGAINMSVRTK